MTKKILYVDMDGVLADFEEQLYRRFPLIADMPQGKERGDMIDFLVTNKFRDIFKHLRPMPGAVEAYKILCQHYQVYILSTPMWILPESYTDKREWVEQWLGEDGYKKLILSHNKGLLKGHYLIDDRIKNGVETFEGIHIHFGQEGNGYNWPIILNYLSTVDNWKL